MAALTPATNGNRIAETLHGKSGLLDDVLRETVGIQLDSLVEAYAELPPSEIGLVCDLERFEITICGDVVTAPLTPPVKQLRVFREQSIIGRTIPTRNVMYLNCILTHCEYEPPGDGEAIFKGCFVQDVGNRLWDLKDQYLGHVTIERTIIR